MDKSLAPNPWEKEKEEVRKEPVLEKIEEVTSPTSKLETDAFVATSKPEYLTKETDVKEETMKSAKEKKQFLKKKITKVIFILAPFVLVLLIITIVAMAMGWDKGILKSNVTGYIFDSKSLPIKLATVTISEKKAITDENGKYKIDNLEYGPNKVSVKAEDYEDLSADVVLSRGENKDRNFTLQFISYSYIQGKLLFNETSIDPAQFKLMIGNLELSVNTNGEFKSGKLEVGKAKLTLTSPIYKDVSLDIDLVAGKNIAPEITLVPAKDVKITTTNYLVGSQLPDTSIKYQTLSFKTDSNGEYILPDFVPEGSLDLKVEKSGYLSKTVSLKDVVDKLTIELAPVGKIYYTSNRDGPDNLYSSNYDGSEEKKLTDGKGTISRVVMAQNGDIFFYSDRDKVTSSNSSSEQLYSVPINGGSIKKIGEVQNNYSDYSGSVWNTEDIFPLANKFVLTSYTSIDLVPPLTDNPTNKMTVTVKNLIQGTNEAVIFDANQRVSQNIKIGNVQNIRVSDDGKKIEYSYQYCESFNCSEKVIVQNTDGGGKKEILSLNRADGYITDVLGFTLNAKYLVYSIYDEKDKTESIFSYNVSSGKITKFSGTNFSYWEGLVGKDEGYAYYKATRDSKTDIYRLNLENGTVEKLTSSGNIGNYMLLTSNILLTEVTVGNDSKLQIQAIGSEAPKDVPVRTTFLMWPIGYNYGYGY